MTDNSVNDAASLKSIRTWEIDNDEASTQQGSVSEDQFNHADTENRNPVTIIASTSKTSSTPAIPSFYDSSRVSQQSSGWFLVRWMAVFAALWMSLFSWIGNCVGICTDHPLPTLQVDPTDDTASSLVDATTTGSIYGTDADSLNTSRGSLLTTTSSIDAKTNLEKYCLLVKRQLVSREIVLGSRDKKKLEKKCDYLLQWIDRNPYARREDYVRGLDDLVRYSDKLISRPPTVCPVT